jgi:hypothetical protein
MQSQKNIFKNDREEERFFFRATAALLNYFVHKWDYCQ